MDLPPLLIQTAGSLVAILVLAGLARWMKLGSAPRIENAADASLAAHLVEDGFTPVDSACDAAGAGALVRDAQGRIMVIRRHGNHWAGRVLTPQARATCESHPGNGTIVIDCGETRFGRTVLTIPDPETWAAAINRVKDAHNA